MFSDLNEAAAYVRDQGIRMIDLKFCDLWGRWRHLTIPASQFGPQLMTEAWGLTARAWG